jgi:hypothetical protein
MELSVAEAARAVGVTEEAVRSSLREGKLHGRRVQRGLRTVWVVDADAVDEWRQRRPHAPGAAMALCFDDRDRAGGAAGVPVAAGGELEALRAENARLRAALAALVGDIR